MIWTPLRRCGHKGQRLICNSLYLLLRYNLQLVATSTVYTSWCFIWTVQFRSPVVTSRFLSSSLQSQPSSWWMQWTKSDWISRSINRSRNTYNDNKRFIFTIIVMRQNLVIITCPFLIISIIIVFVLVLLVINIIIFIFIIFIITIIIIVVVIVTVTVIVIVIVTVIVIVVAIVLVIVIAIDCSCETLASVSVKTCTFRNCDYNLTDVKLLLRSTRLFCVPFSKSMKSLRKT